MDLKITFSIPCENVNMYSVDNGKQTFSIKTENGNLETAVYYDFNEKPLYLCGKIEENDNVEINLISYKLELIVNGETVDEEWYAGKRLFLYGDEIVSNIKIAVSEFTYEEINSPSVIGHFENAEGWKPEKKCLCRRLYALRKRRTLPCFIFKRQASSPKQMGIGCTSMESYINRRF